MRTRVRVIQGRLAEVEPYRASAIEAAYQHFRLDKQGSLVSPKTLRHYEGMIRPFLCWLEEEHPGVGRFEQLGVDLVREYRVVVAQRSTNRGRPPEPATLNDLHRRLMTFLRWAEDEGYAVDSRMRRLKAPRVPLKEATVLHVGKWSGLKNSYTAKINSNSPGSADYLVRRRPAVRVRPWAPFLFQCEAADDKVEWRFSTTQLAPSSSTRWGTR